MHLRTLVTAAVLLTVQLEISIMATANAADPGVVLVRDGEARAVIVVAAETMQPDRPGTAQLKFPEQRVELERQRLRESVNDLARYLEKMSGAKVPVINDVAAAGEGAVRILVGTLAAEAFGPPAEPFAYAQGFRVVVTPQTIGLIGESDLASSYAIYEVLDRLGCRWYLPSAMGEHVPQRKTIELPVMDFSGHPYTYFRAVWYADEDYKRRNRMGGLLLNAGHALERYVTEKDREEHPEWRATVNGKPHKERLRWSAPGLADAIASAIITRHEANPQPTYSLSPGDGLSYDNSPEDRALDAGDFDASIQDISLTDRLVWFCNQIAAKVTATYPEVRFGMLSYVPYSRPPVRETLHEAVVPQIAPITFSRAHPISDDGEPNNKDLRYIIEGWGSKVPATSVYFYAYFLAEPSSPNPMIRKWSHDVPYVFEKGACRYWQPETLPNFETSAHALYLGNRLAWDPTQKPEAILAEMNEKLYGAMASDMAAYWDFVDRTWVDVPEYAGCGFGHLRRWTPQRLAEARRLLDQARAAARTEQETFLAGMYDRSLTLFEQFMQMRRDLADGRFDGLDERADAYLAGMTEAIAQYQPQYAFTSAKYAGPVGVNGKYFKAFYDRTYRDAARLARETRILTPALREWRWQQDADQQGDARGFAQAGFDDSAWSSTDVAVDTWSALGMHNYMGTVWYRRSVEVTDAPPAGKKAYLWLGATDGSARAWVNGQPVSCVVEKTDAKGKPTGEIELRPELDAYCVPVRFDITDALRPGANQVTIAVKRTTMNELGTGGMLAPAVVYSEK